MHTREDVIRFVLSFSEEQRKQFEISKANLYQNTDPIVNYLNTNDPRQYVINGLLLCEAKMEELIAKHVPGTNLANSGFIDLLKLLQMSGLLDKSEIPPYKKLNDLRNRVAHQLDYQVTKKDANDIWNTFNKNQRAQIEQKYSLDRKIVQETPDLFVKGLALRLYTHLDVIVQREDARLQAQAFLLET